MKLTTSYDDVFRSQLQQRYRWAEARNAAAIINAVAPGALADLHKVLEEFELTPGDLLDAGGQKSDTARRLDEAFRVLEWRETHLRLRVVGTLTKQPWAPHLKPSKRPGPEIEEFVSEGQTHKVDNFKDRVAIEVEWNAKDGNLDRDLSAFRALHEAGVIDAAVIITRHHGSVKHAANFLAHALGRLRYDKFGNEQQRFNTTTTTNLEKLGWRLARGDAGGCPVLAVGISVETYTPGLVWHPKDGSNDVEHPVIPEPDADTAVALAMEAMEALDPAHEDDDE